MAFHMRKKNELLVLTGSVYAFVAYLTAFALEILFIIDLAKQNNEHLMAATASNSPAPTGSTLDSELIGVGTIDQARLALDSMQAHITMSCLAISVLYFVLFIASLILIIALIIKSTSMLLVWMCVMTTLYLPEFGLITYVALYSWGIDTRNGQVELVFYLFRAVLNILFIVKAHKLFKDWNYEKNFFRLKSSSSFTGYDSPYFIGDSLTTTINPVFTTSSSTLNRYDQVRANYNQTHSIENVHNQNADIHSRYLPRSGIGNIHSTDGGKGNQRVKSDLHIASVGADHNQPDIINRSRTSGRPNDSALSIDDDEGSLADYEMNLDYRTLTSQRGYQSQHSAKHSVSRLNSGTNRGDSNFLGTGLSRGPAGLSYSTQSLDRRHLKDMDFALPEQVTLRPLGHQPFEYLQRPGSSSNLSSRTNVNINPATFNSNRPNRARDTGNIDDRFRHKFL